MERKKAVNVLLTLLLLALLAGFALAVPAGQITDDAQAAYSELDTDDEFDFL